MRDWVASIHGLTKRKASLVALLWFAGFFVFLGWGRLPLSKALEPVTNVLDAVL